MKHAYFVTMVVTGTAAQAHPGHMAEATGHDHWLGAAAIGVAIAIGIWAALKGRKDASGAARTTPAEADDDTRQEV